VENILSIDKNRFFYEWMEPSSQGKALVKQLTAIDIDQGRWEQFDEQDHGESREHVASLHFCCRNFDSVQFHTPINGPVRQAVFWVISRLWLICCERKTLFHG
jgi:hypothetical protein